MIFRNTLNHYLNFIYSTLQRKSNKGRGASENKLDVFKNTASDDLFRKAKLQKRFKNATLTSVTASLI